jgi:hypothetical protein
VDSTIPQAASTPLVPAVTSTRPPSPRSSAAEEQLKITRLRLGKLVDELAAQATVSEELP